MQKTWLISLTFLCLSGCSQATSQHQKEEFCIKSEAHNVAGDTYTHETVMLYSKEKEVINCMIIPANGGNPLWAF